LYFFLNGEEKIVEAPRLQPQQTLLQYLRDEGLTGTKLGCGEGGCGACTITVANYDNDKKKVIHKAVNACIAPLCSVDGCHVITVEGIGNAKSLHPVQKRLADAHGSQCGFCTPGFVMSMYALLRTNATPSKAEVEHCVDGNLCRCTGYRPILDAFKTFCPATGEGQEEAAHGGCCKEIKDGEVPPYAQTAELPFPPQLLPEAFTPAPLKLVGELCTWYRPTSLDALLALKNSFNHAKIVVGNSELEIERKFRGSNWEVLICTSHVAELNTISVAAGSVELGSSVALNRLYEVLQNEMANKPASETRTYQAVLQQLRWFAGTPIRNVGCVGGNVANASPISDLNPVLMACGAKMTLVKVNGERREMFVRDFFKQRLYRQTALGPDELILSFSIPATTPLQFSQGYKISRRRDDDIAIVTAGLHVSLEQKGASYTIATAGFAYGGMAASSVNCPKTQEWLVGKEMSHETLKGALAVLAEDLPLEPGAPGGMIEFRRTLAASFLFKFFIHVMNQTTPDALDASEKSAGDMYSRPISKGLQHGKETKDAFIADPIEGPFKVQDGVGSAVKHAAADVHVSGEAQYTDDIPNPPGGLYAGLVLSSQPHARIVSVDASPALAVKGVKGYFDHKDVPGSNALGAVIYDEEVFATNTVVTTGQVIGVIAAETQAIARQAAQLVKVEYERLPHVLSIKEAIAANSYIGDECVIQSGDVEGAMAGAEHTLEGEVHIGGQEHFYLETQTSLVIPGERDEMTVWSSTQNPTKTSNFVASVLGVPKNRVVTKMKRMGGGFGGKETRNVFIAMALAVAAKKLNKPVRIALDRDQDMSISGQRHPFLCKYKVGFTAAGKIMAVHAALFSNGGCSLDLSRPVLERAMFHIENGYAIPNVRVTGRVCRTNLPSNTAFRGFGGPQGIMACETYMDDVARFLNLAPDHVRGINLYPARSAVTPYGQPLVDCHMKEMWDSLLESADYTARAAGVEAFNAANRWKKRGIATTPVKFGMSFTAKFMNQASALVHVYTDGTVLVSHGGTEMGQGLHTKMSQIAASELGVPLDKVFVSETATDKCANTHPTAASVGADLNGFAVQDACQQINKRLEQFRRVKPEATFAELTMAAWLDRVDLSAHGFYKTPEVGYDFVTGTGKPFHYFSYGVACSEVEVDVLTGDFTIVRADILHDVGNSLNPAVDIGQVEGGFVQGVGLFMLEEMIWMKNGSLFTKGPSTYKIPSANDVPIDFRVKLFEDAPNRRTIYSSKGVGEPPLNLAASAFFAAKAAVASARAQHGETGPFRLDTPASCERLRLACGDHIVRTFAPKDKLADGSW